MLTSLNILLLFGLYPLDFRLQGDWGMWKNKLCGLTKRPVYLDRVWIELTLSGSRVWPWRRVQSVHYLSRMFSSVGLFFRVMFQTTVRLNLLFSAGRDQACVAAERDGLKAENQRHKSDRLRRITTEGHVCIRVWGRIEHARTCICVTHLWAVIEPPQGRGSRQSFACSNNNSGNLTTQAEIYNQSLRGGRFLLREIHIQQRDSVCVTTARQLTCTHTVSMWNSIHWMCITYCLYLYPFM